MDKASPLILAIETSTPVSSVALFRGKELMGCQNYVGEKVHARMLTTMIGNVVSDCGFQLKDLSAVAVSKGPGSYTGLRVGVSSAKGLCMALQVPLLSFGSLDALALQVRDLAQRLGALICPMIDARRMEVYCEIFDDEIQSQGPAKASIIDSTAFPDLLKARKVIFVGNGAAKCKAVLETASQNAIVLPSVLATAASAGVICFQKYIDQQLEDLAAFEPYYLKEFATTLPKNQLI